MLAIVGPALNLCLIEASMTGSINIQHNLTNSINSKGKWHAFFQGMVGITHDYQSGVLRIVRIRSRDVGEGYALHRAVGAGGDA